MKWENDDPILARINNVYSHQLKKRKATEPVKNSKRQKIDTWKRNDLRIIIPETCQHEWARCPREMNEHTTYECTKCGMESGFA